MYNEQYYIQHHGIKGMHWGVRRFQNEDGSLKGAGKSRYNTGSVDRRNRPNMVNRTKDRVQRVGRSARLMGQGVRNADNLWQKGSEIAGYGRRKTVLQSHSEMQAKLRDHSKTKLGKAYHDQWSKNYDSYSKYNKSRQYENAGQRVFNSVVPVKMFKTPYSRLSGRTTTVGKQAIDTMLTGGLYGLAADAVYLHKNKQK